MISTGLCSGEPVRSQPLLPEMTAVRDHPWPPEINPRILEGFTDRTEPVRLTRVAPVVVVHLDKMESTVLGLGELHLHHAFTILDRELAAAARPYVSDRLCHVVRFAFVDGDPIGIRKGKNNVKHRLPPYGSGPEGYLLSSVFL